MLDLVRSSARLFLCAALFVPLAASRLEALPAYNNDAVTWVQNPNGGTLTNSFNVAVAMNSILFVAVNDVLTNVTPTVTYGGQALTIVSHISTGFSDSFTLYALTNPPNGANDLAVTAPTIWNPFAITALTYSGVDQALPIGAKGTTLNANGAFPGSVFHVLTSTGSNSLLASMAFVGGSPSTVTGSSSTQTLRYFNHGPIYSNEFGFSLADHASAGIGIGVPFGASFSGPAAPTSKYFAVAIELLPGYLGTPTLSPSFSPTQTPVIGTATMSRTPASTATATSTPTQALDTCTATPSPFFTPAATATPWSLWPTVIEDDFSGASLDGGKWAAGGASVTQAAGMLTISEDVTDTYAHVQTVPMALEKMGLRVRHWMAPANNFFLPHINVRDTNDSSIFIIRFQSSDYALDYCNDPAKFNRVELGTGDPWDFCAAIIGASSSDYYFGRWTETILSYDSVSGQLVVDLDADGVIDLVHVIPANKRQVVGNVYFSAYGWGGGGHLQKIDDITITGIAATTPTATASPTEVPVGSSATTTPSISATRTPSSTPLPASSATASFSASPTAIIWPVLFEDFESGAFASPLPYYYLGDATVTMTASAGIFHTGGFSAHYEFDTSASAVGASGTFASNHPAPAQAGVNATGALAVGMWVKSDRTLQLIVGLQEGNASYEWWSPLSSPTVLNGGSWQYIELPLAGFYRTSGSGNGVLDLDDVGRFYIGFNTGISSANVYIDDIKFLDSLSTQTPTPSNTPSASVTPTASGTVSSTGTPTMAATPTPCGQVVYRINVGGPAFVDAAGNTWIADQAWDNLTYGHFSAYSQSSTASPIGGTVDDPLYQDFSVGAGFYVLTMPSSSDLYEVRMHFIEPDFSSPGSRNMQVGFREQMVEGQDLDVFTAVGKDHAWAFSMVSGISAFPGPNNQLWIQITGAGSPIISAIEARQLTGGCPPDTTPVFSRTPTAPASATVSPTPSATRTITQTQTWTATVTSTVTSTRTVTPTLAVTATATPSPTLSATGTVTSTPTRSHTTTQTATSVSTAMPTFSMTETPSSTLSSTATVTATGTGSVTATKTSSVTGTLTATSSRTAPPTASDTPSPAPSATPTWTGSPEPSATATVTQELSASPTATCSPTPGGATATPAGTSVPVFAPEESLIKLVAHGVLKKDDGFAQAIISNKIEGPVEVAVFGPGGVKIADLVPNNGGVVRWQFGDAAAGTYYITVRTADGKTALTPLFLVH